MARSRMNINVQAKLWEIRKVG